MSPVIILWHPTAERFLEIVQGPDDREVFLVLPDQPDPRIIDAGPQSGRVSLLVDERSIGSIDYGVFRRMQRNRWTLMLCHSTDDLAVESHASLERLIEVAQKFRIDVDFLLTLPGDSLHAADAVRIVAFLASNAVRRVSFAYPLLLSRIGIRQIRPARTNEFFDAFFESWLAGGRAFVIDDVHLLVNRLETRNAQVTFIDERCYDADGPIAELLTPGAAANSRNRCAHSCEYYLVCGGDVYGAKALFNGTLDSSDNPYCALVAKPLFARALTQATA
jgi:hypothetical protein